MWMLETIREYAGERLEDRGETQRFRERHAEWSLRVAEEVGPSLEGRNQRAGLDRLELERANIRAALAAFRELGRQEDRLRLALATWRFWYMRGPSAEGERALVQGMEAAPGDVVERRPTAFWAAANFAYARGEWARAAALYDRALTLARRLGDLREQALALLGLFGATAAQGNLEDAKRHAQEAAAVAEAAGDPRTTAVAASVLGIVALQAKDYPRARSLFEQAIPGFDGEDYAVIVNLGNLALAALRAGDIDEAAARIRENLELALQLHDHRTTAHALEVLAAILAARGRPEVVARILGAGDALREVEQLALQPLEAELHRETETAVAEALAPDVFSREFEAGRSADLSQVVRDALDPLG
jgi:tetratricopeptide (TPR) repeat protein